MDADAARLDFGVISRADAVRLLKLLELEATDEHVSVTRSGIAAAYRGFRRDVADRNASSPQQTITYLLQMRRVVSQLVALTGPTDGFWDLGRTAPLMDAVFVMLEQHPGYDAATSLLAPPDTEERLNQLDNALFEGPRRLLEAIDAAILALRRSSGRVGVQPRVDPSAPVLRARMRSQTPEYDQFVWALGSLFEKLTGTAVTFVNRDPISRRNPSHDQAAFIGGKFIVLAREVAGIFRAAFEDRQAARAQYLIPSRARSKRHGASSTGATTTTYVARGGTDRAHGQRRLQVDDLEPTWQKFFHPTQNMIREAHMRMRKHHAGRTRPR
jgi:hypothetical protein